jgi:hypothetical protein
MNNEHDERNGTVSSSICSSSSLNCIFFLSLLSKVVQRVSSIDSLEQTDGENLHFISGYHQWINTNENHRVEKLIDDHHPINLTEDDDRSIELKTLSTNDTEKIYLRNKFSNEEEDEHSLSHMDISFDIQFQINHGQIQPSNNFSSNLDQISLLKTNLCSYAPEMDMENGENHTERSNGYSRNNNNEKPERTTRRQTNGANPNRNNNNSRR